ncbi:MAG: 4Fe-4S binding protein [Candidatus Hodarchaeota archaeon]
MNKLWKLWKRCYFGARILKDGKMQFKETLCTGCGLCARSCGQNAIIMIHRVL